MDGQKLQSAMEYLMTYGWAILIILVVLVVLYMFGVFTPGGLAGTYCTPNNHFLCKNLLLTENGTLSFVLGQNTGFTVYNIGLACASATNTSGGAEGTWYYLNERGQLVATYNANDALFLENGQQVDVSGLQCYAATGSALDANGRNGAQTYSYASAGQDLALAATPISIGTHFNGVLWLRYTTNTGAAGIAGNPWDYMEIGAISAVAGITNSSAPISASTSSSTSTASSTSSSTSASTTIAPTGTYSITADGGYSLPIYAPVSTPGTLYICGAAVAQGGLSPINWTFDEYDNVMQYAPYTGIGRGSNTCGMNGNMLLYNNGSSIVSISLANAPIDSSVTYTAAIFNASDNGGWVNYTITENHSFVAVLFACAQNSWANGCNFGTLPSRCQSVTGTSSNWATADIAICQNQSIGTYTIPIISLGPAVGVGCSTGSLLVNCENDALAVYVYPNYSPSKG